MKSKTTLKFLPIALIAFSISTATASPALSSEISDVLGRVQETTLQNGIINMSNLPKGTYFIQIRTEEKTVTQKVIKN